MRWQTKYKVLFVSTWNRIFFKFKHTSHRLYGVKNFKNSKTNTIGIRKIFPITFGVRCWNIFSYFTVVGVKWGVKKFWSVYKDNNGVFGVLPRIQFVLPGFTCVPHILRQIFFLKYLNCRIEVKMYKYLYGMWLGVDLFPTNAVVCFLGYNTNTYARAAGTSIKLYSFSIKTNCVTLLLPSGVLKTTSINNCKAYLGRNFGQFTNKTLGKFGKKYDLGFRPEVRGVAMNPCDHPHGGRAKTNKPEVSPWMWVAKVGK